MIDEAWSLEEITLYEEWCEAWYHPDFDWDNDLTPDGEYILSKAERIGPPPVTYSDDDTLLNYTEW